MNRRMVVFLLGRILFLEALLMLPSVLVGIIYREAITWCFLPAIGALALLGLFGLKKPKDTAIYAREGFLTVAAAWVLMSLFGAVPLWRRGPRHVIMLFNHYLRCLADIHREAAGMADCVVEMVYSIPVVLKGELPCLCSVPC